jgi:dihydroorotate dehydrogenase electron transfer subunit
VRLSGWHTDVNEIRTVEVKKVETETAQVRTFYFEDELCAKAKPGQFIMAWIPSVDEIPLSLSSARGSVASITVKTVGEATQALNNMTPGNIIGVRGPFGTHFKVVGKKVLVVGGGTGTAPLMMLTDELLKTDIKTVIVEGAKTRDELLFLNQLRSLHRKKQVEVTFTTDDGSHGMKGFATDAAQELLDSQRFDAIYTCGNEAMTAKMLKLAEEHETPMQASLERIMLCAMGICGSCVIGRYRVCKDGPVFNQTQLKEMKNELGKYKRGFNGQKVPITN